MSIRGGFCNVCYVDLDVVDYGGEGMCSSCYHEEKALRELEANGISRHQELIDSVEISGDVVDKLMDEIEELETLYDNTDDTNTFR